MLFSLLLVFNYYIIIMVSSMAKKKKKSSKKSSNTEMKIILFGLMLLLIGILGFGFGAFGALIKKGALFLVGEWWILILLFLIFISLNLLFKRKLPNLISSRLFGFYLLLIVLLVGSHFYFIESFPPAEIIDRTVENCKRRIDTIGVSASIFTSGEESINVGGGIIGGTLAYAFDSLFNKVGTIIVLIVSILHLDISWNIMRVFTLLFMLLSSCIIFFGIFLMAASYCFFTVQGLEVRNVFTDGGKHMAQYPIGVFSKGFVWFFTFIIPYSCVNYYPLLYFLGKSNSLLYAFSPLLVILYLIPSIFTFNLGMKRYTSVGS